MTTAPSDWPPAPPSGYETHTPFDIFPWPARLLLYAWVPLSIGLTTLLLALIYGYQDAFTLFTTFIPPQPAALVIYGFWVLALIVPMVVIHESIHAIVAWALGFDIGLGIEVTSWLDWRWFIIPYGEFQTRVETALIAIAPVGCMAFLGAAGIALGSQAFAIASALIVLFNTAGSIGDVATVLLMWALPSGALVRHSSDGDARYDIPE